MTEALTEARTEALQPAEAEAPRPLPMTNEETIHG